jgi:hypothetical protein
LGSGSPELTPRTQADGFTDAPGKAFKRPLFEVFGETLAITVDELSGRVGKAEVRFGPILPVFAKSRPE